MTATSNSMGHSLRHPISMSMQAAEMLDICVQRNLVDDTFFSQCSVERLDNFLKIGGLSNEVMNKIVAQKYLKLFEKNRDAKVILVHQQEALEQQAPILQQRIAALENTGRTLDGRITQLSAEKGKLQAQLQPKQQRFEDLRRSVNAVGVQTQTLESKAVENKPLSEKVQQEARSLKEQAEGANRIYRIGKKVLVALGAGCFSVIVHVHIVDNLFSK